MALRDVIYRNGLIQKDIAEAIGVTPETLSRWSKGHVTPGGTNLGLLLDHLRRFEPGITIKDILPAAVNLVAPSERV